MTPEEKAITARSIIDTIIDTILVFGGGFLVGIGSGWTADQVVDFFTMGAR